MSVCGRIEDLEYELEKLKASSECVAICWIEPDGLCSGCGRSLKDINAFGKEALTLMREIEELKNGNSRV
jgi:predicted Fe-S protein YdhL (DUF1289 family)